MPHFYLRMFILGVVGGALPDVIRIIKAHHNLSFPKYLKRAIFWFGFFLLLALGGFAAWLFSAQNAKEAILFGFAAPELFSRLASKQGPADRHGTEFSVGFRDWWSI